MEFITKCLKELKPALYNPRVELAPGDAEYEKIKASITAFGMVEPIVWNRTTDTVVGGHQRVTVLNDLGYTEVEVSVVELELAEEKALNIALNKITGEWDDEKLAELLEEIAADANEMLLEFTGFTDEELDELLQPIDFTSPGTGDDEAPSRETNFTYQEQFGVIVICKTEDEQRDTYEKLLEQGYTCRVVAT